MSRSLRPHFPAAAVSIVLSTVVILFFRLVGSREAAVSWMARTAHPLVTCEPADTSADLAFLGEVVADARIVALGEGTHGTREFFQLKHRMVQYLVTELGFSVVAIEASTPDAWRLNDYVLNGVGNAQAILQDAFPPWDTSEVLALIEWMRSYNASGRGRVEFAGFDMRFSDASVQAALEEMKRASPAWEPEEAWFPCSNGRPPATEIEARRFVRCIEASRERLSTTGGPERAESVLHLADVCLQRALYSANRAAPGEVLNRVRQPIGGLRDSCLAANVVWLAERAARNARIVLWAHNWHVSRSSRWMGQWLARRYGDAYLPVAFATAHGRYTAVTDRSGVAGGQVLLAPAPGSVETMAIATGLSRFLLDLRLARRDRMAESALRRCSMRSIGFRAQERQFFPTDLLDDYDLLVWVRDTQASRRLPAP